MAPTKGPAMWIHMVVSGLGSPSVGAHSALMKAGPVPTAGLNAPPEIGPAAKAPTMTVKPIARP